MAGLVRAGRGESGVIRWTPAPGMLNEITGERLGSLASRIAWRSDPAPESLVLVTTEGARRSSSGSRRGRREAGRAFEERRERNKARSMTRLLFGRNERLRFGFRCRPGAQAGRRGNIG